MHAFVCTHNRINRTGFYTECASNAPVFIDPYQTTRAYSAVFWVQRDIRLPADFSQAAYTFIAAGWTLVDSRFTGGDGICIGRAIRVAATRALRLRQYRQ